MEIVKDEPVLKVGTTLKKGAVGGVVGVIAVGIVACFPGLTPEQQRVAIIGVIAVLEVARNTLKRLFPRVFKFF